jgi:radical SAM superfamily enzyme YgiQ (UPF0313 family)
VIRELKDKRKYGRDLLFVDNDFARLPKDTKALLERMIEEDLGYDIMVLTRSDVAKHDELLALMRKAGVTQLFQGYESVEPMTLLGYNKRHTIDHVREAIDKIHAYGFRISGSFVLGADTDNLDTVDATVQFVLASNLTIAYFFPLWGHYIEQKNNGRSIVPRHRAIFKGWMYCDGNFVSHFPKNMPPSKLQTALVKAHDTVFSAAAIVEATRRRKYADAWEKAVHRMMWKTIQKGLIDYIPWLEEIEHGLYDNKGRLLEDRLLERTAMNPLWSFPPDVHLGTGRYAAPVEQPVPLANNIRCTFPAVRAAHSKEHP